MAQHDWCTLPSYPAKPPVVPDKAWGFDLSPTAHQSPYTQYTPPRVRTKGYVMRRERKPR